MAHNHPPPWMNSNMRLGAFLPVADDGNVSLIDRP